MNENGKEVEKDNGYERKIPYTTRQTYEAAELNTAGTSRAATTASSVAAIEEVNKWTPFLSDLYYNKTAKRVAQYLKLKKAEFDASNFPVPPKPEKIEQMKRGLIGYRFSTDSEFQKVQWTIKRLEDLSHAFFG